MELIDSTSFAAPPSDAPGSAEAIVRPAPPVQFVRPTPSVRELLEEPA